MGETGKETERQQQPCFTTPETFKLQVGQRLELVSQHIAMHVLKQMCHLLILK